MGDAAPLLRRNPTLTSGSFAGMSRGSSVNSDGTSQGTISSLEIFCFEIMCDARRLASPRQRKLWQEITLLVIMALQLLALSLDVFVGWSGVVGSIVQGLHIVASWVPLLHHTSTSDLVAFLVAISYTGVLAMCLLLALLKHWGKAPWLVERWRLGRLGERFLHSHMHVFFTVLATPLMLALMGNIRCDWTSPDLPVVRVGRIPQVSSLATADLCSSTQSIVTGAIGTLASIFVAFLSVIVAITCSEFRSFPKSVSSGPQAARFFSTLCMLRSLIIFLSVFLYIADTLRVLFSMVAFITLVVLVYQELPFYRASTNGVVIHCCCSFLAACIGVFLMSIDNSVSLPAILVAVVSVAPLCVAASYLLPHRFTKIFTRFEEGMASTQLDDLSEVENLDISNLASMFEDDLAVEVVVRRSPFTQDLGSSWKAWSLSVLELGGELFPGSPYLAIFHALALLQAGRDSRQAYSKIKEVQRPHLLSWGLKFAWFSIHREISEMQGAHKALAEMAIIKRKISQCRVLYKKFWKHVVQENANVEVFPNIIDSIFDHQREIEEIFRRVERQHPRSPHILRQKAEYVEDLLQDEVGARALMELADYYEELDNQERRQTAEAVNQGMATATRNQGSCQHQGSRLAQRHGAGENSRNLKIASLRAQLQELEERSMLDSETTPHRLHTRGRKYQHIASVSQDGSVSESGDVGYPGPSREKSTTHAESQGLVSRTGKGSRGGVGVGLEDHTSSLLIHQDSALASLSPTPVASPRGHGTGVASAPAKDRLRARFADDGAPSPAGSPPVLSGLLSASSSSLGKPSPPPQISDASRPRHHDGATRPTPTSASRSAVESLRKGNSKHLSASSRGFRNRSLMLVALLLAVLCMASICVSFGLFLRWSRQQSTTLELWHKSTTARSAAIKMAVTVSRLKQSLDVTTSVELFPEVQSQLRTHIQQFRDAFYPLFQDESRFRETLVEQPRSVEVYVGTGSSVPTKGISQQNARELGVQCVSAAEFFTNRQFSSSNAIALSPQYWFIIRNTPFVLVQALNELNSQLQTQEHDSTVEYSHSILGVTVAGVVVVVLFSGLVVWPVYAIQRKRYHMSLRLFLTIPQMAAIGIYRELRRAKGHQQHHQLSGGMHRSISSHDMLGGDPLLDTESRHEMETAGLAAVQSAEDALVSRSHWAKELPFRSLVVVVVTLVVLSLLFAFSQRAADYSQEAGPIINHGCRRDSLLQTLDLFLCQSHQCIRVEDLSPHGGDSAGVQSLTTPLFSAAETLSQLTSTAKQLQDSHFEVRFGESSPVVDTIVASQQRRLLYQPRCQNSGNSSAPAHELPPTVHTLREGILFERDCFSINTLFSRMVSQAQGIVVSNSGASSSVAVSNSTAIFMVETIPLLAGFVAQSFSLTQSSLQDTLAREELKSTLVFSLGLVILILATIFLVIPSVVYFGQKSWRVRQMLLMLPPDVIVANGTLNDFLFYDKDVTETKLASTLRKEEVKLELVLERASEGVMVTDSEGILLSVNDSLCRLSKYSREELLGQNVKIFVEEPVRQQHDSFLRGHLASKRGRIAGRVIITNLVRKDDGRVPVSVALSEAKLKTGVFFCAFVRDGTHRRKETAVLEDEKDRAEEILEGSHEGIILTNMRGEMQQINAAAAAMFQWPMAEMRGNNVSMLMPSPFRENHQRYVDQYLETNDSIIVREGRKVEGMKRDGTIFPLFVRVVDSEVGGERFFASYLRDLSSEQALVSDIVELGHQLNTIVEKYDHCILVTDHQGNITQCNDAAVDILGWSAEELENMNVRELVADERHRRNHDRYIEDYLRTGRSQIVGHTRRVLARQRGGDVFPVDISIQEGRLHDRRFFAVFLENMSSVARKEEALLRDLAAEKKLLQCAFPPHIQGALSELLAGPGNDMTSIVHPSVSVFACDLVNFTRYSSQESPEFIINMVSSIFDAFDQLAFTHHMVRVKIIGDAYLAVAGLDENVEGTVHAQRCLHFASQALDEMEAINLAQNLELGLRIGVHSGMVVEAILGEGTKSFELYGEAYDFAQTLESLSGRNRIHVSRETVALAGDAFEFEEPWTTHEEVEEEAAQKALGTMRADPPRFMGSRFLVR